MSKSDACLRSEIYLAGGCFWGVQAFFDRIPGVAETECGYAQGTLEHPTYEQVCWDHTGHAETVRVVYDPSVLPLDRLLDAYFMIIHPEQENRQGADCGPQYRTGVYYSDDSDEPEIKRKFQEVKQAHPGRSFYTELEPLRVFWRAEEGHQKYLDKNPGGYCHVDLRRADQFKV